MHKPSILVVDDEPLNLKLSAECLAQAYAIHLARSGEEALIFLEKKHIDIILLDIKMPGIDGFETAHRLRTLPMHENTPIIYLTADTSEETIEKAFDSGAVDYITKPFKQKELQVRVKNRLETERLKRHNEHLLEVVKSHIAYVKTDLDGIITEVSTNLCDLFMSREDTYEVCCEKLLGRKTNIFKSGRTSQKIYTSLWSTLQQGETFIFEVENRNFRGGTNWYKAIITPDTDDMGEIIGYIAFYHNIDEKIKFEHDAYTDFLTGLNNRSKFDEVYREEMLRVKRYETPLTLILADIDHFKRVNDTYGHDAGDDVLKAFSAILSHHIRETDFIARWGGEEFIILCPNTDAQGAAVLAEVLRAKIEDSLFPAVDRLSASFGVAQLQKGMDAKSLFQFLDDALYQAKEQGRNRVIIYENID